MAIAFVIDVSRDGVGTTAGIDTTGADFLIMAIAHHNPNTANLTGIEDSKGNAWNPLTKYNGGNAAIKMYYCVPTSVGSGHTFTCAGVSLFAKMAVAAFSGVLQISPFEEENGAGTSSGTTQRPGSVTPDQDGSLIVSAVAHTVSGSTVSIDSEFTENEELATTGNYGIAMSYLIQGTAGAINPTSTCTSTAAIGATQAVFKPAVSSTGRAHLINGGRLIGGNLVL